MMPLLVRRRRTDTAAGADMQAMEYDATALSVTETTMQDWLAAATALRTVTARPSPSVPGALAPHPRPPRPEILPARSPQQRPLRVVTATPGPRGAVWSGLVAVTAALLIV